VKLDRYIPLSPTLIGQIPKSKSPPQPLSLGLVSTVAGRMYPVDGHPASSFLQQVADEPFDLPQTASQLKNQCDIVLGMGATHINIELPVHPAISLSASRKGAMQALASLFVGGQDWNWRTIDAPWRRQVTFVPNYPFDKRRCWIDRPAFGVVPETDAISDTRKRSTELAVRQWKEEWKATDPALRREHVQQLVVRVVSQTLG
ncbi:MAG: hypothetical protein KDA72_23070, partial [Planctomycetales bacterium]|nr:hypothetical protein [Planctomycetales bacterium]